jgi:hypothetical protein
VDDDVDAAKDLVSHRLAKVGDDDSRIVPTAVNES